jgi:sensor domain CHASE-containing protein
MTIRNRVILLIITSVVTLVLVLYGAASSILLNGFGKLEYQNVRLKKPSTTNSSKSL